MKIRRTMQDRLRNAWHGPLPLRTIARQTSLGESTIRDFWAGLKAANILPSGPRPYFTAVTAPPPRPANDEVDLDDEVETAAAPSDACDVLRKHHAPFESAPFNSVSEKFLMVEFRRPVEGPTPGELRLAAREYDRLTRSFA